MRLSFALAAWATVAVAAAAPKRADSGLAVELRRIGNTEIKALITPAFETFGAGKTDSTVFDLARMFDLSPGGEYTVQAHDSIPAANSHLNTTGSVPYASNTLRLHVDRSQARHNPRVHGPAARGCSWSRWPSSAAGC